MPICAIYDSMLARMSESPQATPPRIHRTLLDALLAFQQDLPRLQKDAINPAFKGAKYVTLEKLTEQTVPVLNEHGLLWITMPAVTEYGPALDYRLIHVATNQEICGSMPLLLKTTDPQAQGSALTYARRYSMMTVLGLVANEDDDGQRATVGPQKSAPSRVLSTDELSRVLAELKAKNKDLELVLGAFGLTSAAHLTNAHAYDIRAWLDGKKSL